MRLSIFNDEIGIDITEGISHFRDWGLEWIDLRGRVMGKQFSALTDEEMSQLADLLKDHGLKVACLQSSLAKVHLPEAERLQAEKEKLEGIVRAADALDCRLVRAFFYWQPKGDEKGCLNIRPDMLQQVLDQVGPLVDRAKQAGLTLAFENCGVTVPECLAVLDALNVPEWGLAWDCANEWLGGEAPNDKQIQERVKRTRCVHVKAKGAIPGLADVDVPWEKILLTLATNGFKGPVSVETHNPDKSVSNVEMSKRLVDRVRQAWPGGAPAAAAKAELDFEPVRFVIVGLGMGYARAKQLKKEPGTEVIGVVDLDEEKAKKVGEELAIEYTTDLQPWLDRDDTEAVFVMTPTGLHADIAVTALEAGKHVITTKPMEASLEACDRMIEAADKAGKLLAVDFAFRLEPQTQRIKQRIAAGDLGRRLGGTMSLKVLRTMEYFQKSGGWRGTRKLDGGGIMSNQTIHHIDELVYILGLPRRVSLNKWTQTHEIEAEDLGCAIWEYEDGSVVQIFATTSYPVSTWYRNLELHGTEGTVTHITGGPYSTPIERWYAGGKWEDTPPEPQMLPWSNLGQNLAAAIRTGAELVCDGRDGRRSRLVLDKMYGSAAQGGAWVDV